MRLDVVHAIRPSYGTRTPKAWHPMCDLRRRYTDSGIIPQILNLGDPIYDRFDVQAGFSTCLGEREVRHGAKAHHGVPGDDCGLASDGVPGPHAKEEDLPAWPEPNGISSKCGFRSALLRSTEALRPTAINLRSLRGSPNSSEIDFRNTTQRYRFGKNDFSGKLRNERPSGGSTLVVTSSGCVERKIAPRSSQPKIHFRHGCVELCMGRRPLQSARGGPWILPHGRTWPSHHFKRVEGNFVRAEELRQGVQLAELCIVGPDGQPCGPELRQQVWRACSGLMQHRKKDFSFLRRKGLDVDCILPSRCRERRGRFPEQDRPRIRGPVPVSENVSAHGTEVGTIRDGLLRIPPELPASEVHLLASGPGVMASGFLSPEDVGDRTAVRKPSVPDDRPGSEEDPGRKRDDGLGHPCLAVPPMVAITHSHVVRPPSPVPEDKRPLRAPLRPPRGKEDPPEMALNWCDFVGGRLETKGLPRQVLEDALAQWKKNCRGGTVSGTLAAHCRVWDQWLDLGRSAGFDPISLESADLATGFSSAMRSEWSAGLKTVLANTCRILFNSDSRIHENYLLVSIVKTARSKAPSRPRPEERKTFDVAKLYNILELSPSSLDIVLSFEDVRNRAIHLFHLDALLRVGDLCGCVWSPKIIHRFEDGSLHKAKIRCWWAKSKGARFVTFEVFAVKDSPSCAVRALQLYLDNYPEMDRVDKFETKDGPQAPLFVGKAAHRRTFRRLAAGTIRKFVKTLLD